MGVNRSGRAVRRSISLSGNLDAKIQKLARHQNWSTNRVIESLIEAGVEAKEAEKRHFFELVERLRASTDEAEIKQIKEQLARMTFGV
jgi:predicted transcriptional regulator